MTVSMPLIRLPEGATKYDDSTLELTDDYPYVDIGFSARLPRDQALGLSLLPDDHQDDLTWYRWFVLGDRDPSRIRKTGAFSLVLRDLDAPLRVYLFSARVLTREQHQRMLFDIERFAPAALWDHPGQQSGRVFVAPDGSPRADRKTEVVSLLIRLSDELAIAESALLGLAWELAPPRPGLPPLTSSDRGRDFDLNENRAIAHWARRRLQDIEESGAACSAALADMQAEAETLHMLSSDRAREHVAYVNEDIAAIEGIHASLRSSASRVLRIQRELRERGVSDAPWYVTPSITRNPCVASLVASSATQPQRIHNAEVRTAQLSLLAQRLSCRIYEVWVALAVARIITALDWMEADPPKINFSHAAPDRSLVLPYRIVWSFARGEARIQWLYNPRVATLDTNALPHHLRGLHLSQTERIAEVARVHGRQREFVTANATNAPDYILQFELGDRTAFVVADATFSDIRFDKGTGLRKKIDAIRTKYAQKIIWIDEAGRITPCSVAPSFAVCPHVPGELHASISKHAHEHQALALELAPWQAEPPAAAIQLIASILATLEWSCTRLS